MALRFFHVIVSFLLSYHHHEQKYVELVAPPVDGTDATMDRTESSSDGDWETANGDVCAS